MNILLAMRKTLTLPLLLFVSFLSGQDSIERISDSLVAEGVILYRSEMASWYGTDIFLEKYTARQNIGGYFSYTESGISKCIFFSKVEIPKVIGTISFDSTYDIKTAQVDMGEREFSEYENQLFVIRSQALKAINSDTLFKAFENTSLNLIPLISNGMKKVYVLTGPKKSGVVIFGNDYLLRFSNNNELTGKTRIHKNIIPVNYGDSPEEDKQVFGTMHSHLPETGDYITATDICTLMLYEKFSKWQQHIVTSDNYFSIWDCNKNTLAILTRQAMEKIFKDQNKKRKKDKEYP